MGIGEGLIYALAGGAEGGGKAMQNVAMEELKTRNALDMNKALLQQKEEIENMRRQRIADILAEVKTRVDDPTHPEGARDLTPQEAAAAKAAALEGKGMVSESEKYRQEENRLRDDAQRQRERAEDILLRERRADIEDKRYEATRKHQERMDARTGALADIQVREAKEKEAVRGKVRGLINAEEAVDMSQPGGEQSREFYRKERQRAAEQGNTLLRAGSAPDTTAFKEKRELAMSLREEARAADKEAADARKEMNPEAAKEAAARAQKARNSAKAMFRELGVAYPDEAGEDKPKGGKSGAKFFETPAELAAAKAKGEVKSGDMVDTPQGPKRVK